MMPLVDVERATISRRGNGSVVFDDAAAPWVVRIRTRARTRGHPDICQLLVTARSGRAGITQSPLTRLPLSQMLDLATTESPAVREHPNEAYFRMLAKPKPPGQVGWGDEHWNNVLLVFNWARETKRQGGGWRAIAEFWGVTERPTAKRWMIEARKKAGAGSSSQP